MKKRIARFVMLLVVTGFAVVVAITFSAGGWGRNAEEAADQAPVVIPKTPVSVLEVDLEPIEITDSYSGTIRPLERFSLGFELAGRVIALGTSSDGKPLDEGDQVTAGQVLARLDDRVLLAQLKEAKARREQAQSNMNRAKELKGRAINAITDTEYQDRVTELALAEAQLDTAEKNLEDSRLVSPVDGTISKRLINPGESVNPHQTVFEVIQVDDVLLVVGVPEAYVSEIHLGQPVHVELLARNRFRQKRPQLEGRVYRVAQAADDSTSLFEVEIMISNSQGELKPGLIALAHIVVDRVHGFRVPMNAAVFRDEATFLFAVGKDGRAHRLDVKQWIEQEADLIFPELPPDQRTVVVRGQHRLVEGREVRLVRLQGDVPVEISPGGPVPEKAQDQIPVVGSKP